MSAPVSFADATTAKKVKAPVAATATNPPPSAADIAANLREAHEKELKRIQDLKQKNREKAAEETARKKKEAKEAMQKGVKEAMSKSGNEKAPSGRKKIAAK
jgi:hypothetical protein